MVLLGVRSRFLEGEHVVPECFKLLSNEKALKSILKKKDHQIGMSKIYCQDNK